MNRLRHTLLTAALAMCLCTTFAAQPQYRPRANDAQTVVAGNARFTVLTPQMIRMEWSEDGRFEDNATLGVVNRAFENVEFRRSITRQKIVITTEAVRLT
ncbi:MAG: DUF4968 domain-containing protein, partial [Alistipes sp.]|nr:DUF4968 domain-containing protein [Alistipes sp.]